VTSIVVIVETKHKEVQMPTMIIEAPTGIRRDAKKRLMEKTTAALN
jgi:hypothetical protein